VRDRLPRRATRESQERRAPADPPRDLTAGPCDAWHALAVDDRRQATVKISLDRIDSRGLVVDLPGTAGERVAVRSVVGLQGLLEQAAGRLTLSNVAAEALALDALRLLFGSLVLSCGQGATFADLSVALDQRPDHLALDVRAASVTMLDLGVVDGDVVVGGGVTLVGARLSVRDAEGTLAADGAALAGFTLRIGDLELSAGKLSVRGVVIRWGAAGFSLTADALEGPALRITSADLRVALNGARVRSFSLDDAEITVGEAAAETGTVAISFAATAAASASDKSADEPAPEKHDEPLLDWRVLDAISGQVDVDVEVDLSVPVIGSRNATHRMRVAIDHGALDYRALESNLSTLEDALLDFSVRDGALRLETVNPLFPARGHGKPIVVWDLEASDVALAEQGRVRLAVLTRARLADRDTADTAASASPEPADKSAFALRKLAFHRIDVRLALTPSEGPPTGQLRPRGIGALVAQGHLVHVPGEPSPPGSVLGELSNLSASVVALRLDARRLDVASLTFASLSPIEMTFADVDPTRLVLELSGMALAGVRLAPS